VIELVGMHRLQERHIVDNLREVRQMVGHPGAGFAMLFEGGLRTEQLGYATNEGEAFAFQKGWGRLLPVELLKQRLVIEQFVLTWSPCHVQEDDMFGLGGKVGRFWHQRVVRTKRGA